MAARAATGVIRWRSFLTEADLFDQRMPERPGALEERLDLAVLLLFNGRDQSAQLSLTGA
jgi:hypothetical protein